MKTAPAIRDKVQLLFGPYAPPPLKRGDRAHCLVRDCLVVITAWTDAPISWPRGYAPSEKRGGGPGLLVDEELARAVRRESAAAVGYLWGVSRGTVARWRAALGVTRKNSPGSQRLVRAATARARKVALEVGITPAERERRRRLAAELRFWESSPDVTYGRPWAPKHLALLGAMPDPEVARRTGHTLNAVRLKRQALGVPRFPGGEPVGAWLERRTGRWCASISVGGKRVSLGTFASKAEAHRAYLEAVCRFR